MRSVVVVWCPVYWLPLCQHYRWRWSSPQTGFQVHRQRVYISWFPGMKGQHAVVVISWFPGAKRQHAVVVISSRVHTTQGYGREVQPPYLVTRSVASYSQSYCLVPPKTTCLWLQDNKSVRHCSSTVLAQNWSNTTNTTVREEWAVCFHTKKGCPASCNWIDVSTSFLASTVKLFKFNAQ